MAQDTDIFDAAPAVTSVVQRAPQPAEHALVETGPAALMRLAIENGDKDLDRLERLWRMQLEFDAVAAKRAFTEAMAAFKSENIEIVKRKEVSFNDTHYKHAELSDVTAAVCPMLSKHDLSHRWDCEQRDGKIIVSCVVTHKLGHSERLTMEAPADTSGKKNAIQSIGSTKTYLERYTLLGLLGLSTKGEDDDGRNAQAATAALEWAGEEILGGLLAQLEATTSDAAALAVWKIGLPALKATKSIDVVNEFRQRVEAHRLSLREAA